MGLYDLSLLLLNLVLHLLDLLLCPLTGKRVNFIARLGLGSGKWHLHLLGDELDSSLDCALGLNLFLLQQYRTDELVDVLVIL